MPSSAFALNKGLHEEDLVLRTKLVFAAFKWPRKKTLACCHAK